MSKNDGRLEFESPPSPFYCFKNSTEKGVGNGKPAGHGLDKADNRYSFPGHCITVIEAGTTADDLKLTAASPNLAPAHLEFSIC